MKRSVAVLTISAVLGACSLVVVQPNPHKASDGKLACRNYALPVVDLLVGAALSGLALAGTINAAPDEEQVFVSVAGAIAVLSVASFTYGLAEEHVCRERLWLENLEEKPAPLDAQPQPDAALVGPDAARSSPDAGAL